MATLNNITLLTPLIPSSHVPILNFFVPGSTSIVVTIKQVLAINSYTRGLFVYILLAWMSRHVLKYL